MSVRYGYKTRPKVTRSVFARAPRLVMAFVVEPEETGKSHFISTMAEPDWDALHLDVERKARLLKALASNSMLSDRPLTVSGVYRLGAVGRRTRAKL